MKELRAFQRDQARFAARSTSSSPFLLFFALDKRASSVQRIQLETGIGHRLGKSKGCVDGGVDSLEDLDASPSRESFEFSVQSRCSIAINFISIRNPQVNYYIA
ncbi:hypothetical protein PIB30_092451 [Stylosanthes scabra]|uniref:Uncharacterized protein n=1 Tax=Stylosanthes scabra TaxID=79078 RepID=A0ABU6SVQ2_9FABA|nr:hypothetical protein [Stylosanthes scabra]